MVATAQEQGGAGWSMGGLGGGRVGESVQAGVGPEGLLRAAERGLGGFKGNRAPI